VKRFKFDLLLPSLPACTGLFHTPTPSLTDGRNGCLANMPCSMQLLCRTRALHWTAARGGEICLALAGHCIGAYAGWRVHLLNNDRPDGCEGTLPQLLLVETDVACFLMPKPRAVSKATLRQPIAQACLLDQAGYSIPRPLAQLLRLQLHTAHLTRSTCHTQAGSSIHSEP
jgi:hypothetical protein